MSDKISGNLVDIVHQTIYPAVIELENGKIQSIQRKEVLEENFLIPGFIDSHIHIESSLLPPSEFARLAVMQGVLATVSDPHEIANVLGLEGIEYMLENASKTPFKFYFGASSCVPATDFETSGGRIGPEEIRQLFSNKKVKYLTEVMNFPGVIQGDPALMAKIMIAKELQKKIDGHAPGLTGESLKKYIASGIDTDHECTSIAEAKEKISLGMKILIREGSAARNFDALFPLLLEHPEHCMLCSDDIDPVSLIDGGIRLLVKKAVARGVEVMEVLRSASLNPIKHYGLEVGLLQPGDPADFIVVDNLVDFNVLSAYLNGQCVMKKQKVLFPKITPRTINNFHATKKEVADFQVSAGVSYPKKIKVIEIIEGQLVTNCHHTEPFISDGKVCCDISKDILKIAMINRYKNEKPCIGFIKNFGLRQGAVASSVCHDCHNIIAVGATDEALCKAINLIISHKGGLAVVGERFEECLPLPIAALMSDQEGRVVAKQYKRLGQLVKSLGCSLKMPFMTLSFMGLLVIPSLKISDQGLFDGEKFAFTSLFD